MGASRDFSGTSQFLQISDNSVLQDIFDGGGSVAAWINQDGIGETAGRICNKSSGTSSALSGGGWAFHLRNNSGNQRVQFAQRWTNTSTWYTNNNLSNGDWKHVCVTYDDTSSGNNPIIYVDGVSQTLTESISPSGTATSDVGDDLYIGDDQNSARAFDGQICYVQMWDKILTNDEVFECMYKPGSVRTNLVGYWPILGVDSPEKDLSGNGNTGTVTGASENFDGPPVRMF